MKTTFDIPRDLLNDLHRLAKTRETTAKALVEEALRALLEQAQAGLSFQLPDASVGGDGLSHEFEQTGWDAIRNAAYGR